MKVHEGHLTNLPPCMPTKKPCTFHVDSKSSDRPILGTYESPKISNIYLENYRWREDA